MDQEEQLLKESEFAQQGKLVLDNKAYQRAMVAIRGKIFEKFCKTKDDETDKRDEMWRQMKVLDGIEEYFTDVLTTGKLADHSLKAMNKEAK